MSTPPYHHTPDFSGPGAVAIVALKMTLAESVARQAAVSVGHALQIVEHVFERHLGDLSSTQSAHKMLNEAIDLAHNELVIKQIAVKRD